MFHIFKKIFSFVLSILLQIKINLIKNKSNLMSKKNFNFKFISPNVSFKARGVTLKIHI